MGAAPRKWDRHCPAGDLGGRQRRPGRCLSWQLCQVSVSGSNTQMDVKVDSPGRDVWGSVDFGWLGPGQKRVSGGL